MAEAHSAVDRRENAKIVKRHGAAVVVMAFDEQGQAATFEEKVMTRLSNRCHFLGLFARFKRL
jgi:cobalamin-dependent methionine synthase I